MELFFVSSTGSWSTGGTTSLGFAVNNYASIALASDVSTLAVSHFLSGGPNMGQHTYEVYPLQWNGAYQFTQAPVKFTFVDQFDSGSPTSWSPVVVANSMVAVAGNLLRFNGQSWLVNSSLRSAPDMRFGQQRYAYGPDYGALVHVGAGSPRAQLVGYDANEACESWTSTAAPIAGLVTPSQNQRTANFAAGGTADYLVIGTRLFFRGTATNWASAVASSVADLESLADQAGVGSGRFQVNSASIINEAPGFVACALYDLQRSSTGRATAAAAFVLRNGGICGSAQLLVHEQMWTSEEVGDQAGTGKAPGGPQAFFTYPDTTSNLDGARTIYLHRYAADGIAGALSDWPVSEIVITDGLSESTGSTYVQDASTAACDPSGQIIKYFKSTVYPGGTPANPTNGSVISTFLNGTAIDAANYYNALDGLLQSVTTCDASGAVVASVVNDWSAFVERASDPIDPAAPLKQLYGAYVLQTAKESTSYAVSSTQTMTYVRPGGTATFHAQPTATTTMVMNGADQQELVVVANTYACEVGDTSIALNDLTSLAAQTTTRSGVTTDVSVTTMVPWHSSWAADVQVPAEEADFRWTGGPSSFPFPSYVASELPPHFQRVTRIARRDARGSVLEQRDGSDTAASTLYAATGLPIAAFRGASLDACAFCSFESYEDLTPMRSQGGILQPGTAWFGTQSMRLPRGASLSPAVAASVSGPYLLTYRYRTARGYQPSGSRWFIDTAGEWRYVSVPLPAVVGAASPVEGLRLENQGSSDVLVDSVLLIPLGAEATLRCWDPKWRLLRASMQADGAVSFLLYDQFNRPLGAAGADGQLQELSIRYLSRQGAASDRFDDASPNAELTVSMSAGGAVEAFLDRERWTRDWSVGQTALWLVSEGSLSKATSTSDVIRWRGRTEGAERAAFFIELTVTEPLADSIAVRFGSDESISYSAKTGWQWRSATGQAMQGALGAPPRVARQWLLVLGRGYLTFFGDGQLLFSAAASASPSDGFALMTGANSLTLRHLACGLEPRVGVSYTDGAARQRQVHQLAGPDSRVMERVYDALDRQIASTRVAPGRFGRGSDVPTLQYRDSFVQVPAFLAALADSWRMQGDVADYYAGQPDGPVTRSNDEGYPYRGLRYEASPQDKIVESGKEGKRLAIHDVSTTTPAQRQTTRTTYRASGDGDPVEAGLYVAQSTLTPGGYEGAQFVDTANRLVAIVQRDDHANEVGRTSVAPRYDASAGRAGTVGVMRLPNSFAPGPQGGASEFVRTTVQNPIGQVISVSDPDCGTTNYVLDGKGQARFVQVPLEPGERYFHYTRYDALGRVLEEGAVAATWDGERLAAAANDQTFPAASDGAVPARKYTYDGDGSDPNALGRLTRVVTHNASPDAASDDCTVNESWSYDELGRVVAATVDIRGPAAMSATARYHYNNLNEVTQIDLPPGCPLASVTFSYDESGQVVSIGVPGEPDAIASYTYTADGRVQTAVRGALRESFSYDSPGYVVAHRADVGGNALFSQTYTYTADSQVATRTTACDGQERSDAYEYDGQQRLIDAVIVGAPGSETVSAYDADGNVWRGSRDGQPFSATCSTGTNRLASAVLADGRGVSFHYRADGNPDQWRGWSIRYDRGLAATATVTNGEQSVRYARGLNNARVLRQQGSSTRVSFQGAGHTPLVIWENGKAQVCVWGPMGLVAVHDGSLCYPIADHQSTVWAVVDAAGALKARYAYRAFGGLVDAHGERADSWPFRFCGKEWDGVTELYDFGARLYDPALLRFLAADAARQYASPYVFSSNNPINVVDPSGNISVWAQVGIGAAMAAVALGGVILSTMTLGAAAAPTAAAEGALAGAAAGGEAAAVGGEVAGTVLAEGAGAGAGEVAAGATAEAAAPLTTAQAASAAQNVVSVLQGAGSGLLTGTGTSGLQYDIEHGRDFTAGGFFAAVGRGALTGIATGGIGKLASMPATLALTKGMSITGTVLFRALAQATAGMVGSDVATLLTDAVTGQRVTVGQLLRSSATGFGAGALSGTFAGVKATDPAAAGVNAAERGIVKASSVIKNSIDRAVSAAKSQPALATYIAGGFFLTNGYIVWGVYESGRTA